MAAARLKTRVRSAHLKLPRPLFRLGARLAPLAAGRDENLRQIYREQLLIDEAVFGGELGGRKTALTSDRVVEVPWVFRHARSRVGRILDVGTAYALDIYKRLLTSLPRKELHLLDLAPTDLEGAVFHLADIRATPFDDRYFDVVICVSTLEHVGLDTSDYFTSDAIRPDEKGDVTALRELGRVTRNGGRILLTVPGGDAGSYGWYRQYDAESFAGLVQDAGLSPVEVEYFVHDSDRGWRPAAGSELKGRRLGVTAPFAAGLICAALEPAPVPSAAPGT